MKKFNEFITEVENLEEKNKPTQPEKWARAKAAAKSKFAVYPSAYANAWASKKYKALGGGWRSTKEEVELDEMDKSQKSQERHGDYPLGIKNKDANMVKSTTSKKVNKDTLSILQKKFNQAKAGKLKEEVEIDEDMKGTLKKIGSKVLSKLGHGDDEAMRKDLQRKMGVPQTGKKPTNEEKDDKETPPWDTDKKGASPFKKPHNPNRTGMDSARALAQKAMKKQTKEEVEVDETFKGPEAGSGTGDHPFVTNENSPMKLVKDLAKKSYKKIRQETMMGKIAGGI